MLHKLIFFFKESWLLMVSSVLFGLLLAVTQSAWGPKITENQIKLFNAQASMLLPQAKTFEQVTEKIVISAEGTTADVRKGLDGDTLAGWIFVVEGSGFADKIRLVVAVDGAFKSMKGFNVLASNETPGFGDKIKESFYQDQYKGAPASEFTLVKVGDDKKVDNEIIAITGATVTSQAVVDMMNVYVLPIRQQLIEKGLLQ